MEGDWFGLAASAAGGGMFGVIGTALGRFAGFLETRQKNAFEKSRWGHELDLIRLQMEARQVETEMQVRMEDTKGSWAGLSASLQAETAIPGSYPFVNAVRALTRPALTLLLWLITALVFFNVEAALKARIVETAVFAATAATLWWFGDRTSPVTQSGRQSTRI